MRNKILAPNSFGRLERKVMSSINTTRQATYDYQVFQQKLKTNG